MTDCHVSPSTPSGKLSPLWVRAVVWLVLVGIAALSIWWIDRRAIQRMHEMERQPLPITIRSTP